MEKKKSGLFGLGGKKEAPGSMETKSMIVRSWGWIAIKTAPELITSRLDAHVFMHLIPIMNEANKSMLRESVVVALQRIGTAMGVIMAKLMNKFSKQKINPLIGSAGVSAVPMAARVSNKVGLENNPQNFLLMHAMGPNVAGVIGSAVAAGVMISMVQGMVG